MFLLQSYKGLPSVFRTLGVVVLVVLGYVVGQIPITALITYKSAQSPELQSEILNSGGGIDFSALDASENLVFFLLLLMFVVAMLALYRGVTWLNRRPFLSIATSRTTFDWRRFFFGFSLWFLLSLILEGYSFWQDPSNYTFQFELSSFLVLLLLCIAILPIQTAFEELFIRGYLLQEIGFLTRNRWIPLLVTSLIFGLMHMMNPEVQAFGWKTMLSYYVLIAMFLGILALIDDGLELSIGIHTATNFFGATMVTFEDSAIQTPAIFRMESVDPGAMTIWSLGMCLVFLALVQRRYRLNWNLLFGSFVPTDIFPPKLQSEESARDTSISFMNIDWNGHSWLTTKHLINPMEWFKSPDPIVNFEVSLPEWNIGSDERILNLSEEKRQEILTKISEFANTDMVRYSEKLRLNLDDGSKVHLILQRSDTDDLIPRPDLNWPTFTLILFPVTDKFYDVYNQKMSKQLLHA